MFLSEVFKSKKTLPDMPDNKFMSLFGRSAVNRYERLLDVVLLDTSIILASYILSGIASNIRFIFFNS